MKPRTVCVNGDGRPVQPPSMVLCKECLDALDAKLHEWQRRMIRRAKGTRQGRS